MKASQIRKRRGSIDKAIAHQKEKLADLQANCPHENKVALHRSSTGNYDPDQNSYWVEYSCIDCGLRYTEESQ